MTIFAVIALNQNISAALTTSVAEKFNGKFFQVSAGHFLINGIGTAQEISTQLNITNGSVGQAIVYNVAGYFGYGPNPTWEWLRANMTTGAASG
jgi:hypothetical protein